LLQRRQVEMVVAHTIDRGRLLQRRAVVMVRAHRRRNEVDLMPALGVAGQLFVQRRCAALAAEGPDFEGADHEYAQEKASLRLSLPLTEITSLTKQMGLGRRFRGGMGVFLHLNKHSNLVANGRNWL